MSARSAFDRPHTDAAPIAWRRGMLRNRLVSLDGFCLSVGWLQELARRSPKEKLALHDVTGATTKGKFFRVTIGGLEYWAGEKTGTLFDVDTGRCLTSRQLWLVLNTH